MSDFHEELKQRTRKFRLNDGTLVVINWGVAMIAQMWKAEFSTSEIVNGEVKATGEIQSVYALKRRQLPRKLRMRIAAWKNPKISEVARRVAPAPVHRYHGSTSGRHFGKSVAFQQHILLSGKKIGEK